VNYTVYPSPSHLENITQLSINDDLRRVANINVVTIFEIDDLVEDFPTLHVVDRQLKINPHHPAFCK
jgi:hypothetical protein